MPIATPEAYAYMLDRAKAGRFAYPAINVTSSQTLHAALRGFAEAESDGIVQASTGGAEFLSGTTVKNMVLGAQALAAFAHHAAKAYPATVALHTDHCPKDKPDDYVRPLIAISRQRVAEGGRRFSRATCGTAALCRWWKTSRSPRNSFGMREGADHPGARDRRGGRGEDGVVGEMNYKLYTTSDDAVGTVEALGAGERGRYLLAATFGNVHGVYHPGNVKLRPEILREIQEAAGAAVGKQRPFDLVFHGGSGSTPEEIRQALDYGVVKMNVDTDTQYAFTRPIADHMFRNYDSVLKVDGEVGGKAFYDPRSWGAKAESGMAGRVTQACQDLGSAGQKGR